jgi:hypothetical protein
VNPRILAFEFSQEFKKRYQKYCFSMKSVENTRWWVSFKTIAERSSLPDGYEQKFVSEVFNLVTNNNESAVVYPTMLISKSGIEAENYLKSQESQYVKPKMSDVDYIVETFKKAKLWCKKNSITENCLKAFFTDRGIMEMASRGFYYLPLFLFSRPYIMLYGDDKLQKSAIRAFHPEVYEKLKSSLGDDFLD